MKKILTIAAFGLLTLASANAQLKGGAFGVGASFAGASPMAHIAYAASSNFEFMLMAGFTSTSIDNPDPVPDPDSESSTTFGARVRYFLRSGDVSPYLGAEVMYSSPMKDDKTIGFNAFFGGQADVVKNVGIYGHLGIGIDMNTKTVAGKDTKTTMLGLFTTAVGAVFYF